MAERAEHQPFGDARGAADRIRRDARVLRDLRGEPPERRAEALDRREQNELFARARHRDVEHAQLLGGGAIRRSDRDRLARQRRTARAGFRVREPDAEAERRVQAHVVVLRHEAPPAARDDADRELEPLRLVDAHDAHDIGVFGDDVRRLHIRAVLFQPVDEAHKAGNAVVPVGLILRRILLEQAEVREPSLAARHRPHDVFKARLVAEHRDECIRRHRGGQNAVARDLLPHAHAARILRAEQRDVQRFPGAVHAQPGHIVRREAVDRAHQHREQRDVLIRVVDHAQEREDRRDLARREEAAVRGRPRGDAERAQALRVARRILVRAAQQNAEIAVGRGALRAVFGHGEARRHHGADHLRDALRLEHLRAEPVDVVDELDARLAAPLFGVVGAGRERLAARVIHAAARARHELRKHEIDALRHVFAGAEVAVEHDGRGVCIGAAVVARKRVLIADEDVGHRLPEAVDALLHVADHEAVAVVL